MASINDLITREYTNFRGVDFTQSKTSLYRSPDALNMWKSYKDKDCIETRPRMTLLTTFSNEIFGLFFYKINDYTHVLVHSGTKLLEWTNYPTTPAETIELYTGLNPKESRSFVFDNVFFFMDGINYLEYNGVTIKEVEPTIPYTTYIRTPDGATDIDSDTDENLVYQDINVLTGKRKNLFQGDGKSTDYYLDATNLDPATIFLMTATVGMDTLTENIDFTVDREKGIVTFNNAPGVGSEVVITLSKTEQGLKERILNCTLSCEFDNRFFYSGNPDYPNAVFHSDVYNPRYIKSNSYYECGADLANIKGLIAGNNVLWVIKEITQNNSSIHYLTPSENSEGKIYPTISGSISLGCVSKAINFKDDIVFFSEDGLEAVVSSSLYSEQILQHRSSLVDTKMIHELDYKNIKLAEYNGYLVCLINSHAYLADSRQMYQDSAKTPQYEWFYWEFSNNITFIKEYLGELFLGNASGELYKLTNSDNVTEDIESYWTTSCDDFDYPSYTKTTNKRGNVADFVPMNNDEIKVSTIVDRVEKEKAILSDEKGYIVTRIKDKKFKNIQLKFSSNKPFGLISCTLQGFVAGYIKR